MFRLAKKNNNRKRFFLISLIIILASYTVLTFVLITSHLLIVFPFSQSTTKVIFNKSALEESLKLADIDRLLIRPSIIVRISSSTPHPEKLIRFQRTASSFENFIPSFGCNFNYSKFTKRIIYLNFYVKGSEYLEKIADEEEREKMLNQAAMMCLVDVISPDYRNDEIKTNSILKEFDLMRQNNLNIFEFKNN